MRIIRVAKIRDRQTESNSRVPESTNENYNWSAEDSALRVIVPGIIWNVTIPCSYDVGYPINRLSIETRVLVTNTRDNTYVALYIPLCALYLHRHPRLMRLLCSHILNNCDRKLRSYPETESLRSAIKTKRSFTTEFLECRFPNINLRHYSLCFVYRFTVLEILIPLYTNLLQQLYWK